VRTRQRVERAEGLVEEQHLGLHRQGAGDADALLHAARDLRGQPVERVRHVHELEVAQHPLAPLRRRLAVAEHLVDRQRDVLPHREPRQQRMVLEHDGAVGTGRVDLATVEDHAAAGRPEQPGDDVQHRRLAAARVADQRDEFAARDLEVDAVEHPVLGAALALEHHVDPRQRQISVAHVEAPAQAALVPRVTMRPSQATTRSSRKPTRPT
jgi:hypothetical protein